MCRILILYTKDDTTESLTFSQIVDFLFLNLDEFGDCKSAISKSIEYALSPDNGTGGFVVTAVKDSELVGVVVINKTGMSEYIPENILVYIATHREHRGSGIGKLLMNKTLAVVQGDIALHVEYDNKTAIGLYEKLGFESKYIEMRRATCQN
ncbi:MAG: GNAT family N-acetyltransferase [Candidatus Cloacimonetes bacterium]|nr:GNAT family N-acetyltransferase [Candidatus Cloacimonadota bacterium]